MLINTWDFKSEKYYNTCIIYEEITVLGTEPNILSFIYTVHSILTV